MRNSFGTLYLDEKHFKNLNVYQIHKLGLSVNKARTIKELSELFISKSLGDLTILNDEELRTSLLQVFGIGEWSVNMFEIFCNGKLDIFSSKDAGLRFAMNNAGMVDPESDWNLYEVYAQKWSPYKSIASLHLWKTVD